MDALTDRPTLSPPETPLSMPLQNFNEWSGPPVKLPVGMRTAFARLFVFSLAAALSSYAVWEMHQVIGQGSATTLQCVLLFLFGLTFVWIAFAAANALLGFAITKTGSTRSPELTTRTAVAMPIHNENTKRVFSSVARMTNELVRSAEGSHFDLFVLSD